MRNGFAVRVVLWYNDFMNVRDTDIFEKAFGLSIEFHRTDKFEL